MIAPELSGADNRSDRRRTRTARGWQGNPLDAIPPGRRPGRATADRLLRSALTRFAAPPLEPGLYPVATPIGNLGMSRSGRSRCSAAATCRLRGYARHPHPLGPLRRSPGRWPPTTITTPTRERPRLLAMLAGGLRIALVSDAGTPLVSDPGYKLVEAALGCRRAGRARIPGRLRDPRRSRRRGPADRHFPLPRLPSREAAARRPARHLRLRTRDTGALRGAPSLRRDARRHRRRARPRSGGALARELTKRFEEVRRGTLSKDLAAGAVSDPPRGEVVLLVGPPPRTPSPASTTSMRCSLRRSPPPRRVRRRPRSPRPPAARARRSISRALDLRRASAGDRRPRERRTGGWTGG